MIQRGLLNDVSCSEGLDVLGVYCLSVTLEIHCNNFLSSRNFNVKANFSLLLLGRIESKIKTYWSDFWAVQILASFFSFFHLHEFSGLKNKTKQTKRNYSLSCLKALLFLLLFARVSTFFWLIFFLFDIMLECCQVLRGVCKSIFCKAVISPRETERERKTL